MFIPTIEKAVNNKTKKFLLKNDLFKKHENILLVHKLNFTFSVEEIAVEEHNAAVCK